MRKCSRYETSAGSHRIRSGEDSLVLGYRVSRQTGSHIRLTSFEQGEHHITVPAHNPLKVGTLSAILSTLESHHKLTRDELLKRLFS